MLSARAAAVAATSLLLVARSPWTVDAVPNHLNARMPPEILGSAWSGTLSARVSMIYEIDAADQERFLRKPPRMLAQALGLMPLNIEVAQYLQLTNAEGGRCMPRMLRCTLDSTPGAIMIAGPGVGGGSPDGATLWNSDPASCVAAPGYEPMPRTRTIASPAVTGGGSATPVFSPDWDRDNADENEKLVWDTPLCVNNRNTSLMFYPLILNSTFVTGWRDDDNVEVSTKDNILLQLHIHGAIPVEWAFFFMRKFILNGTIPLPEIQPEVFDEFATHTYEMRLTLNILGVRQGGRLAQDNLRYMSFVPVCLDPPIVMRGCFRVDYNIYQDKYSEYQLQQFIVEKPHVLGKQISDCRYFNLPGCEFNMSQGPWPSLRMAEGRSVVHPPGPWQRMTFPQKNWRQTDCITEDECTEVPLVPSARYLHSAVLYTSWNFKTHAHSFLCNANPMCGTECLTNYTCFGGKTQYFSDFFFFRSAQFRDDDGGDVPPISIESQDCPGNCCKDRRTCMRVRDHMGYFVPFDHVMMLVFGGRTYTHVKDPLTGKLIYHSCERIHRARLEENKAWRSCMESVTNDLWRYDVNEAKWQYIKPDSVVDPVTLQKVGIPPARYAHGVAILEEFNPRDPGNKKVWMYLFGGLGPQCNFGICDDVWKYEVAFAAQAFYPKYPGGDWSRANVWHKLGSCPFGGRYRHAMVSNTQNEYIYVYGGQMIGGYSNQLLKYRVSTDVWEDMDPFGRVSLIRMQYDYQGTPRLIEANVDEYNEDFDVDCRNAWRYDGKYQHCRMCPTCRLSIATRDNGGQMPTERADISLLTIMDPTEGASDDRLVVFGGFRTTWGMLRDRNQVCKITTTGEPTDEVITSTSTLPPAPPDWSVDIGPTAPPPGSMSEIDSLKHSSTTLRPTTTTSTLALALEGLDIAAAGTAVEDDGEVYIPQTTVPPVISQPTGQELPGEAIWPTNPPLGTLPTTTNTDVTSTTTTSTSTSSTSATTSPWTSSSTTTATVTTSTQTTLTSSTTSSTATTTTIFRTTTTTLEHERPVINGQWEPPVDAEVVVKRETKTQDQPAPDGPCTHGEPIPYYFDDTWVYEPTYNQWMSRPVVGERPSARRGHAVFARRSRTDDPQLILVGGHNQDTVFGDMWVLNLEREEREWTRIDPYFTGARPPPLSHHTMLYSEQLNRFVIFGGLHWKSTDQVASDKLKNINRRCSKEAQGLAVLYDGMPENAFLAKMRKGCLRADMKFCCTLSQNAPEGMPYDPPGDFIGEYRVRTAQKLLNLTAISLMCRADCEKNAFYTEFYPILVEGVYNFQLDQCIRNCSGHGTCDLSQCVCEEAWYGVDCSLRRCPGSTCYTHPRTREQFCVECSHHGRCINGECQCHMGWTFEDCSAQVCQNNCSSTPEILRGVCIEDFPVHQCHCFGRWSGSDCSDLLCLNDCSGRGTCLDGVCQCKDKYFGDDCSVFIFDP